MWMMLLTVACGDGTNDGSWVLADPPAFGTLVDSGQATLECGPTELCARSIDECAVNLTLDSCEGWYDQGEAACDDMDAYVACNCGCLEEPACDGYFACGEICFELHCGAE